MVLQIVTNLKKKSNIFTEKNPHISGTVQFKPVLFKGQLYIFPTFQKVYVFKIKVRKKHTQYIK